MNVLITDDHEIVRDGLSLLLKNHLGVQTFIFASDGREAIIKATNHNIDLVLLDLSMPKGLDGIHALTEIRRLLPKSKIIIFSMYDQIEYQKQAYQSGADGFFIKQLKSNDLVMKIQQILNGKKIFDQQVFESITDEDWILPLTPREKEAFILTVQGYSHKQISEKMNIAIKTVEIHKRNISKKIGTPNRHQWLTLAQKYNLLHLY